MLHRQFAMALSLLLSVSVASALRLRSGLLWKAVLLAKVKVKVTLT